MVHGSQGGLSFNFNFNYVGSPSTMSSASSQPVQQVQHVQHVQMPYDEMYACVDHFCVFKTGQSFPRELFDDVYSRIYPAAHAAMQVARRQDRERPHPALTPPANGACPMITIPTEIRKLIFADCLPDKGTVIKPKCQDHKEKPRNKLDKAKPNQASTIMLLHRKIKDEMTVVLYEERVFEIHVHEGVHGGGIEFLDAGRQPLQYKADSSDMRFERFQDGKEFGFENLKKIKIVIFPDRSEGQHAHVPTCTYFMLLSLVRLLQHTHNAQYRMSSITVEFAAAAKVSPGSTAGRREIMIAENPYWDPTTNAPRESSIAFLPDFELALRPLGNLRSHNVHIKLPKKVCDHSASKQFATNLAATMQSTTPVPSGESSELERHLEAIRQQAEQSAYNYIFAKGKKPFDPGFLNEEDMQEEQGSFKRQKTSSFEEEESDEEDPVGDLDKVGWQHDLQKFGAQVAMREDEKLARQLADQFAEEDSLQGQDYPVERPESSGHSGAAAWGNLNFFGPAHTTSFPSWMNAPTVGEASTDRFSYETSSHQAYGGLGGGCQRCHRPLPPPYNLCDYDCTSAAGHSLGPPPTLAQVRTINRESSETSQLRTSIETSPLGTSMLNMMSLRTAASPVPATLTSPAPTTMTVDKDGKLPMYDYEQGRWVSRG